MPVNIAEIAVLLGFLHFGCVTGCHRETQKRGHW
jgi:hypothetical protein